jgi:hypothetical protein
VGVPPDELRDSIQSSAPAYIDCREKLYHQLEQLSTHYCTVLTEKCQAFNFLSSQHTHSTLYYLPHFAVLPSFVPVMSFLALSRSSPSSHSKSPFPLFWKTTTPALHPFLPSNPSARVSNLQIAKL